MKKCIILLLVLFLISCTIQENITDYNLFVVKEIDLHIVRDTTISYKYTIISTDRNIINGMPLVSYEMILPQKSFSVGDTMELIKKGENK